jgi:hypothetical protein
MALIMSRRDPNGKPAGSVDDGPTRADPYGTDPPIRNAPRRMM